MTKTFSIKTGDDLPVVEALLKNGAGVPQDLTGATITFAVRRKGSSSVLLSKTASAVAPTTDGVARFEWGNDDTATLGPGSFEGEFQVVLANGKTGSFPSDGYIPIEILRDIAPAPTP